MELVLLHLNYIIQLDYISIKRQITYTLPMKKLIQSSDGIEMVTAIKLFMLAFQVDLVALQCNYKVLKVSPSIDMVIYI